MTLGLASKEALVLGSNKRLGARIRVDEGTIRSI